jgi:hypothetical protein
MMDLTRNHLLDLRGATLKISSLETENLFNYLFSTDQYKVITFA